MGVRTGQFFCCGKKYFQEKIKVTGTKRKGWNNEVLKRQEDLGSRTSKAPWKKKLAVADRICYPCMWGKAHNCRCVCKEALGLVARNQGNPYDYGVHLLRGEESMSKIATIKNER